MINPFHSHLFKSWPIYLSGMVIAGWLLSSIGQYHLMLWGGLTLTAFVVWTGVKILGKLNSSQRSEVLDDIRYWPFPLLLVLIVSAGLLYPSSVLDSLSYRIPRMLMWLQEGGVHIINSSDWRMDTMTPVWEFASTPIYQIFGLRLLWLGSAVSWVILYLSLVSIFSSFTEERTKARQLAVLCASSTGFVLQAASTMNDIWSVALLSLSLLYLLEAEKKICFWNIVLSGLAFSLAANVKPHYAVLALPWLIWLFASHQQPWRHLLTLKLIPIAVVILVCSPLITLVSNHFIHGSISGELDNLSFGSPVLNIVLGSVLLAWAAAQWTVNPLAGPLNARLDSLLNQTWLGENYPKFRLGFTELSIVDSASTGFVVFLLCGLGLILALRIRKQIPIWSWIALSAGIFGILVALSQVVPQTLGRSFMGFFVLLFPVCMFGLARLPSKLLGFFVFIAVGSASFSVAFSPSHPLWPAKTILNQIPQLETIAHRYLAFQQRGLAGKDILAELPSNVSVIGVLPIYDQPLHYLFQYPRGRRLEVRLFPEEVAMEELIEVDIEYWVLIGNIEQGIKGANPLFDLFENIIVNDDVTVLTHEIHVVKFQRGSEEWRLVRWMR